MKALTTGQKAAMTRIKKRIDPIKDNAIALIESYLSIVNEKDNDYTKPSIIAREVDSIRIDCFRRWGDRNNITNGMILHYFRKDVLCLDIQCEIMTEEYRIEITPDDVIDFICSNPNGKGTYYYNKMLSDICGIFKEMTGHNLDQLLAVKLLREYKPKLAMSGITAF